MGVISKIYKQLIQLNIKKKKKNKIGRRTEQIFLTEETQMDNKHMKRCSTSLIIREMQIKTTVRYHFIPVRKAVIKKNTNNEY